MIAIDGPAGTGKSSVSRRVATALGANYIDTGAMYRVATLRVLRAGVALDDAEAIDKATEELTISVTNSPDKQIVLMDGDDVTAEIRGRRCHPCGVGGVGSACGSYPVGAGPA